jgi:hypothetical protein
MATTEAQAERAALLDDPAGTFRLTPEEVEELDEADPEFEADEAAGRVRPIEELIAELRRRPRS